MKVMDRVQLDLTVFDAGAGADGAAGGQTGASAQGSGGQAAGTGSQIAGTAGGITGTGEGGQDAGREGGTGTEKTPQERAAEFEKIISGEYRALYEARVKDTIDRRLKRYKGMETQLNSQNELLTLLGARYGTQDLEGLKRAVENDNSLWEEAAAKEGLTVEEYRYRKNLEAENARLLKQMEEAQKASQRERIFQKWNREAQELKAFYPNFDMETEGRNETFTRLLGSGIDMKTAYETVHHEELMQALAMQTAQNVAKAQADAVKSSQSRPNEAGMNSKPVEHTGKAVKDMSREEILELARRAQRGELIEL